MLDQLKVVGLGVVAAVWFLGDELSAQSQAMRFERISQEQGLSQGTVNCVLQDDVGFLWIGTQDGLNRYDGYSFRIYKHDPLNPDSLTSSWIEALVQDAAGNLWIGTGGGGLARWNRHSDGFEWFRHRPSDPTSVSGDRISALYFDRQGDLWIGTASSGLNRLAAPRVEDGIAPPSLRSDSAAFDRFRHDPDDSSSLSDDRVRAIFEDAAGNLWIGTLSGLNRLDPATGTIVRFSHKPSDPRSLSDDQVLSILEDHTGTLWVGTDDGLNRRDRGGGFIRYAAGASDPAFGEIRSLFEDDAHRLWIGTDDGLTLLPESGGTFLHYRHEVSDPASLSNDSVVTVAQDEGGVLWIGTQGGGINRLDPQTWAFAHYKADPASDEGLSGNAVFAFSEDSDGRLWVGSLSGLDVLDRTTGRPSRYRHDPADPESLPGNRVTALLHDHQGYLWVGAMGHGLGRFDPRTRAFTRYPPDPQRPDSLGDDVIISLYEDRRRELWIGTLRSGLDRFDREDESFVHYRHDPERPDSLSDNQVNTFIEDAAGHLWIGTNSGGLNRLDRRSQSFHRVRHDPARPSSLSSDTVLALHVDAAGVLWVGTQVGLNRLESTDDGVYFKHFLERDGLPNNFVYGIYSDSDGRLWLSTNNGLSRFDPASGIFQNYTASHGLQSNEFNFGAHYQSQSGELFFGGVNGFNAFYPERIKANSYVPPVVLTSFTRLNHPVRFDRPLSDVEEVALDYRDYFFAFEVAALDFAAPEQNQYRYKLEGFDAEWVDLGHRRRVTFTNLDAGLYTLRVQGSNNDGVWNKAGASVRIAIAPPPWKSWWAYLLYSLAGVGLLVGTLFVQRRRLERRKEEELKELDRQLREEELEVAESWALMLLETNQEVEEKNQEILRAQAQLVQSEKMAALGQMVAGVAHEINNPVNFISSGLPSLRRDFDKLVAMIPTNRRDERFEKVSDRASKLFEAIGDGAQRTAETVKDLRTFARLDEAELTVADLHAALDTTLTLLHNQTKNRIEVVRNYGEIPPVECYIGQLNQVFMNLLINAVQAIEDEGTITLTTARDGDDRVRISIRDDGCGMPEEVRVKIFDPFFTTKPIGQGTGLGLSISHGIVKSHSGTIRVRSGPGEGAEFMVILPISSTRRRQSSDDGRSHSIP